MATEPACRCGPLQPLHLGHSPSCPLYVPAVDPDQPVTVSRRGTIVVRLKAHHRSAALRWLRGILIAGVGAAVVTVVRHWTGW